MEAEEKLRNVVFLFASSSLLSLLIFCGSQVVCNRLLPFRVFVMVGYSQGYYFPDYFPLLCVRKFI